MRRSKIANQLGVDRTETTIDVFVALGMLKLDEPKSVEHRALEIVGKNALKWLDESGLKIVEK